MTDPLQYLMNANQPAQSPSMLDQMMTGHPSPVNAPYQQGDFQRSGPQMQRSTPLDALMSTFAPQRDEQGIPKPMGAADIINAGLWVLPGMGGRRPISPAAPRIENPIRAYHGSPHDFDKFDISKIGTGEGAQSYGHGLYFAGEEGVAKYYRDALTARDRSSAPKSEQVARQAFEFSNGDPKKALDKLRDSVSLLGEDAGRPLSYEPKYSIEDYRNAVALVDKGWQPPKGKMYEVNIHAQPEQMLDWDKPIAAQPSAIQEIARKMPRLKGIENELTGGHFHEALSGDILNELVHTPYEKRKWPVGGNTDPYVAETLRDAGIPGIKYRDQGSRVTPATVAEQRAVVESARARLPQIERSNMGSQALNNARANLASEEQRLAALEAKAANPTSNYVVFNDKLIDIMRKYGLAGAGPLGALMAGGNDQQVPQ